MIRDIAFRIAEKMDLKEWNYNTIISNFSLFGEPTHKFILRVGSSKGSWEFFVKVCKDPTLSKYLVNEAKALEYLNGLGIEGVPSLILRDSYYGKEFLVESFIRGRKAKHRYDAIDLVRHWLLNLYSKTQNGFISCDILMGKAAEYVNYLSKWFDLGDVISLMEKYLPSEPLPSVFTHGDFWFDNILVTNTGIGVVDYSHSAHNEPPLDIFTALPLLGLEHPETLASTKRLRDFTADFLPSGVDPHFVIIYNMIRRAAQLLHMTEDLYDNLLLFDNNNLLVLDGRKLAVLAPVHLQIVSLKTLSLRHRTGRTRV